MPIDIALDEVTHDLLLVDRDFVLINDLESFKQGLRIRLAFMAGEWYKDERAGAIDPNDSDNLDLVDARIKDEIMKEEGAVRIISYSSVMGSDRILRVSFSVSTIWGNAYDEIGVSL